MASKKHPIKKPRWLLVDVSNWAYRDLFAAGPGEASFRNFTRRIDLCQRELRPERTVLAFDSDTSFRKNIDATYKANRRESPPGLRELIGRIRDFGFDQGFDSVKADGFEADDCIATLTTIALDRDRRVVIASSDKDLRQLLLHGAVTILLKAVHGKTSAEFEYYNTTSLMDGYGLRPDQWVEYQMLVGDSCDNIRGCAEIGPKTAEALLRSCSTLDAFYKSPLTYKTSDRIHSRLMNFRREGLDRMRRLVTLRHDVPLPAAWFEEAAA